MSGRARVSREMTTYSEVRYDSTKLCFRLVDNIFSGETAALVTCREVGHPRLTGVQQSGSGVWGLKGHARYPLVYKLGSPLDLGGK